MALPGTGESVHFSIVVPPGMRLGSGTAQAKARPDRDMTDFRDSVTTLLKNVGELQYEPRKWVTANYGDQVSGTKLRQFVEENFADRVMLPDGTRLLFPSGA
ncbi:unnamed protein product [Symbiodinium sp. KB8]|nr:unnamed protein product [Symbiodinium sp. KB8]